MSIVAMARRPRSRIAARTKIATAGRAADGSSILLSNLRPGASAEIIDFCIDADPATARRLVDLGFVPGAEVSTVRRAPMADPVIFRVAGCELALRKAQAQCIRVGIAVSA